MAHTPSYERFTASMTITQEMWHDGIGYEVDALSEVTAAELAALVERMRACGDWRDVAALAEIAGMEGESAGAARAALRARAEEKDKIGLRAAEALGESGEKVDLEDSIVETLLAMRDDSAFGEALDMAETYPTERVKRALLKCARDHSGMGVHCAAMLYFHCGLATEAFDWEHRPFFLRFNAEDEGDRGRAFVELCERVGMDPATV